MFGASLRDDPLPTGADEPVEHVHELELKQAEFEPMLNEEKELKKATNELA